MSSQVYEMFRRIELVIRTEVFVISSHLDHVSAELGFFTK